MLTYLTLILICQLIGELTAGALNLPVPGPVLGMGLLFAILMIRGHLPDALETTANGLLRALSLLFVPAGTGVILHLDLLGDALLPLSAALVISTLATIAVTAWLMTRLSRAGDDDG